MSLQDELMAYDYATKNKHHHHDPELLMDLLDKIQESLEKITNEKEINELKGQYGLHLCYLKHTNNKTTEQYIAWMKDYNKRGKR